MLYLWTVRLIYLFSFFTALNMFRLHKVLIKNIFSLFLDYVNENFISFFILFSFLYFFCIVFSFIFKQFLGFYGVFILNFFSILLFWIFTFLNLNFFLLKNKVISFFLFKWFYLDDQVLVNFDIYIDSVSYSFILLTLTIATAVNIYLFSYFRFEPCIDRLILLINAFVFSMIILVSAGNLIIFFFGWELIGLTSFFLINFWGERTGTLKSALKAFVCNKFSDICIFFSLVFLYIIFKEITFIKILDISFLKNELKIIGKNNFFSINIITLIFLLAAFVKSAQFGFHVWLPDSMEAPVPASALIHSATLVSAGIYLILRFYPILELSFFFYFVLALVGSLTAFIGGFSALNQTDLKKILAYSTISHCGFLVFLCSLGNFNFVILYLFIHGFFKAASFFCVGNIIRFSKNYQDLRRMGSYWNYLPFEFFFMVFSLLNLSGLPFFFGFYIKHLLFVSNDFFYFKHVCLSLVFAAAFTGIFYSFKLIYYVFFDFKKARKSVYADNYVIIKISKFYTNTTLASNVSIFFLVFFGYFISFIYLYIYIYKLDSNCDFLSFFGKLQHFFFLILTQML